MRLAAVIAWGVSLAMAFVFGTLWTAGRAARRAETLSDRPLPPAPATGFAPSVHRCLCGHVLAEHRTPTAPAASWGNDCRALVPGGCPCIGFCSERDDA